MKKDDQISALEKQLRVLKEQHKQKELSMIKKIAYYIPSTNN